MKLSKHIEQGKLVYLNQDNEALSVSENKHYRWLAFNSADGEQVIQSVMHKRKPWLLTLPHQTALLMPLLFFRPNNVVELGLGGGNLDRFLTHLSADIKIQSIEYSANVIHCFEHSFNPEKANVKIINTDSNSWLKENNTYPDWLICDIYQSKNQPFGQTIKQLELLIDNINGNACLSMNLPDASDDEVNLCLTVLQQLTKEHRIIYFHVPNYLNIIIHLIPNHWHIAKLLQRNKLSYLPKRLLLKWRKFWLHGKVV